MLYIVDQPPHVGVAESTRGFTCEMGGSPVVGHVDADSELTIGDGLDDDVGLSAVLGCGTFCAGATIKIS